MGVQVVGDPRKPVWVRSRHCAERVQGQLAAQDRQRENHGRAVEDQKDNEILFHERFPATSKSRGLVKADSPGVLTPLRNAPPFAPALRA